MERSPEGSDELAAGHHWHPARNITSAPGRGYDEGRGKHGNDPAKVGTAYRRTAMEMIRNIGNV